MDVYLYILYIICYILYIILVLLIVMYLSPSSVALGTSGVGIGLGSLAVPKSVCGKWPAARGLLLTTGRTIYIVAMFHIRPCDQNVTRKLSFHKITFPDTHRHFGPAIEHFRKNPIACGGLQPPKSNLNNTNA